MSQWFASPVLALQFTPFQTGFTPAEMSSLLVLETTVSRSLGASFSELTGQPTPPYLHVLGPSSSVASSEPTIVLPAQSTVAPVPDPTQTAIAPITAIGGQTA